MIHFKDLKPRPTEIKINDKEYELKPFSMEIEVWAYSEFSTKENENGVQNLGKLIEDISDIGPICRTIYKLLYDKSDFPTYRQFIQAVSKKEENIRNLYTGLAICVGLSQPMIDELDQEVKKLRDAKVREHVSRRYMTPSHQDTVTA